MAAFGKVQVDNTDIGCSDHFLVWIELGRLTNRSRKEKQVIKRWRLDRFTNEEVKLRYQEALKAEVHSAKGYGGLLGPCYVRQSKSLSLPNCSASKFQRFQIA